jgi:CopG-like RHH_1 or ribbon-helix-helix domain, RHH_5
MREKLNLTLPPAMIEELKIQAVREKRAVSEIVEELCRQYLDRQKSKGKGKN